MDILLVTSSFNDEIHGSDDKKKTGCGISLIKPENISKYRIGGVMTDLKEISCDKCKERLAKKIIKSDKKEMSRILKEERAKAKRGIEDEGIVPLGNTTAKITKSPEQRRLEEEARAEAERQEAEAKRAAEEAAKKAEEARKAEEEAAKAAQKNIPGTDVAMDSSLAQFAIDVPKEEEPAPEPIQDDFLAQFAIQKPEEEIQEESVTADVQDDFLAQFAIPAPQQEYMTADSEENSYDYDESSHTYDDDQSIINVSEDELRHVNSESDTQPEQEQSSGLGSESDWDFVANQIFGFEGVDEPEAEPQPTEMEELPLPVHTSIPQHDEIRAAGPRPEVPGLEDIVPPVLEDIAPPEIDNIAPLHVSENISVPILEEMSAPVIDDISAPVQEKISVPALDELTIPEVPDLKAVAAEDAAAPDADLMDLDIPEVPVLNSISAVASETIEDISYPEKSVEEITEESAVESDTETVENATQESVEEITEEAVEESVGEITEEAVEEIVEESAEETVGEIAEEYAEETVEEIAEEYVMESAENAVEKIEETPAIPESSQTAAPAQPAPIQSVSPVQPVPVQTVPPVQPVPVQTIPATQPVPAQQPQIINVPQIAGYDAAGQPIYTYVQMQMTGYDQNGQPIFIPLPGQQSAMMPQTAAPQHRPMMGMSNTMGGQMGANIQKPVVQLDAPTQTPAYIKAKLGDQAASGQYVQPTANISKIAVNPHSKETSKAFVKAISSSKDYANKNLIETQGLRANTPVLSSIEDVLSQMGDNSLKEQKKAAQAEINLGTEYKGTAARPSAPRSAAPKKTEEDIRFMSKSELKEKKKQDKYAAKFKKDLAKRGF